MANFPRYRTGGAWECTGVTAIRGAKKLQSRKRMTRKKRKYSLEIFKMGSWKINELIAKQFRFDT